LPIDILEKNIIQNLVNNNFIVICVGGGGIPVIETANGYFGVDAVIDKDFGSELIASLLNADKLIILTAVDKVMINYGKPNQQALDKLTIAETQKYIKEGQFAAGSMLPKVQAVLKFINGKKDKEAIIGSLEQAKDIFKGGGTKFIS
jgi:carbamate kinase